MKQKEYVQVGKEFSPSNSYRRNGDRLKVKCEISPNGLCTGCYFASNSNDKFASQEKMLWCDAYECSPVLRRDKKAVIFRKIE